MGIPSKVTLRIGLYILKSPGDVKEVSAPFGGEIMGARNEVGMGIERESVPDREFP
jgi:hypothetical protein